PCEDVSRRPGRAARRLNRSPAGRDRSNGRADDRLGRPGRRDRPAGGSAPVAQAIVTRRRRWILIAVALLALAIITLNVLSGFYIDLLWFREVHFSSVFWTIFWSKVVLGILFGIVFFAVLYANLLIVRRLVPPYRTFTPEQEVVERYRVAIEPYAKWILPALSFLIALF